MKFLENTIILVVAAFVLTGSVNEAKSQALTSLQVDSLVKKTLTTFDVPGIAVGIVKDGRLIHAKGYGVRSTKSGAPVDEHTLFGIASNTKAFTAAALGILIDEGKVTWDTKVTDVIPEFKLYDPYVTQEFTIRDLLTHRSGLGLGAGDLMIFPDANTTTLPQLIHNLRYLKKTSSFRSKFDYDNLLYIVAGEVIARISKMSYEDFLEQRIMKPLGMEASAASVYRLKKGGNIIDGHVPYEGKLINVGTDFSQLSNAAGGIYTNVSDMSKWVLTQLNKGRYGTNPEQQLFSSRVHRDMWTPQTILNWPSDYKNNFSSYGLGWFLQDINGYLEVSHTGGLIGIVSKVTIVPELKLGIIVFTNQQSGEAFTAVTNTILDGYLGEKGKDRIGEYHKQKTEYERQAAAITQKVNANLSQTGKVKGEGMLKGIAGKYKDPWFGEVSIEAVKDGFYFKSTNSPKLQGKMSFYKGNTFVVKWNDRSLLADAFATFALSHEAKPTGFKMEAISPLTDFSFDFQDLDFTRLHDK
jgi:CubicO group peptidase (beta-lactamase class C family)